MNSGRNIKRMGVWAAELGVSRRLIWTKLLKGKNLDPSKIEGNFYVAIELFHFYSVSVFVLCALLVG